MAPSKETCTRADLQAMCETLKKDFKELLEAHVDPLCDRIAAAEDTLDGKGSDVGLRMRVDRIEQRIASAALLVKTAAGAAIASGMAWLGSAIKWLMTYKPMGPG